MSDLVAWLIKILDEDEQAAERASGTISKMQNDDYGRLLVPPSWVLADIAAKRALVALHGDNDADAACQSYAGNWSYSPCQTLRLVASAYADRPGYDESWKP